MNVTNIDKDTYTMTDDYVISVVSKDFVVGKYFYCVLVDKRHINGITCSSIEDVANVIKPVSTDFIVRYAKAILPEEQLVKTGISGITIDFITEHYDKNEDTTWLMFQIGFKFIDVEEPCKVIMNLVGTRTPKMDYIEPIKVTNELTNNHPEISEHKSGESFKISIEEANDMLKGNEK